MFNQRRELIIRKYNKGKWQQHIQYNALSSGYLLAKHWQFLLCQESAWLLSEMKMIPQKYCEADFSCNQSLICPWAQLSLSLSLSLWAWLFTFDPCPQIIQGWAELHALQHARSGKSFTKCLDTILSSQSKLCTPIKTKGKKSTIFA